MHSALQNSPLLPQIVQTNLALYKQLRAAGYDEAALLKIRDAYECAAQLFSGHVRASGKPFLSHLAGTASILAALGAPPAAVTAGLLHAAYEQGDWGWVRNPQSRRDRLRKVIGEEAENLAWGYFRLRWNGDTIRRLHSSLAQSNAEDRAVALMRLANELDDNLDLSMWQVDETRDTHRGRHALFIEMAEKLGQPRLAAALMDVYREADEGAWAAPLSMGRTGTWRLAAPLPLQIARKIRAFFRR